LQRHGEIWAAAGTPESVFRMTPAQLQQITAGTWQDLTQG
jgi:prolyl-tRNA editing enzyme YbaK/EbsC (Cys-tRNA(Pro) deacylase)